MASLALRALALVLAASALVLYSSQLPQAVARSQHPWCERCNIVLISFDTVRADHLGIYGYERNTSPNVDRFAERAVVFEDAIAQASWTLPAHGSILSGLYPGRLGVVRYPATRRLPVENEVLPEVLRQAGYATAGFTGGGFVSAHYGFSRGFDVYWTGGRRFEHSLANAVDWLRANKDGPFFLFFHGYDAHRPYFSGALDKKAMGLPEGRDSQQGHYCVRDDRSRPDDAHLDEIVRYYDAAIHHGDRTLAILLRNMERLGLMENTVILLTSDHGEEFFEHGHCDHVRYLYRESVHVPYILYIPHFTRDTRRIPGLIPASISVARTLLDLVGVRDTMPGVTLLPILEGTQREFPLVYSEADSKAGDLGSRGACQAITRPGDKLISYTDEGSDEGYDRLTDLSETHVLPDDNPVYGLRHTLRSFVAGEQALSKPPNAELSPAELRETTTDGSGAEREGPRGSAAASKAERHHRHKTRGADGGGAGALGAGGGDGRDGADGGAGASGASGGDGRGGAEGRAAAPAASGADGRGGAEDGGDEDGGMVLPKDVKDSLRSLGYLE